MADAREQLTRLPEEFAEHPSEGAITVTRRGEPVLAVMPWDFYEALIETMEVMADPDLWKALQRAARDVAAGTTISPDELESRLGL